MATSTSSRSRLSARTRAQRPQLVPREVPEGVGAPIPRGWKGATEVVDLDAQAVNSRGPRIEDDAPLVAPAPAPALAPSPTPQPQPQPLALRAITYEDVDRLWDWCRDDRAGVAKYLGNLPAHSQALYDYVNSITEQEQTRGTALIRSVLVNSDAGAQHVGFVSLLPISRTSTPKIGVAHCYLSLPLQESFAQLLPLLLDAVAAIEPELTLMVSTSDYALARQLEPHGFTLAIALTRPPTPVRK